MHYIGPVSVRIYCRERTLSDCFKFRNKIDVHTCVEALRTYRQQRRFNVDALVQYAAISASIGGDPRGRAPPMTAPTTADDQTPDVLLCCTSQDFRINVWSWVLPPT